MDIGDRYEKASALAVTNPEQAIIMLHSIVTLDAGGDEEVLKIQEQAILDLGHLYAKHGQANALAEMIKFTRPFLSLISKAKAAKVVKALVDLFLDMEAGTGWEVDLCKECIEWAKEEKRTFLRQALECRLIALYYDTEQYQEAIKLGSTLLYELKKLDDKALLVEVQLLESKVYYSLGNLPKARAALTSARTTANGIYCPPRLQAALDLQSGILHAADERDFKTAFSYFYEGFEGYDSVDSPKAITGLKYMLLAKIMMEQADEVSQILSGKLALKYAGRDVEALKSIAVASKDRSLAEFQQALDKYKTELVEDPIIKSHLNSLYDKLLEGNLLRIIEPFSHVQVAHIAGLIKLPVDVVEKKLSQMILDKSCHGILDQGDGVLIIFDETVSDKTYQTSLDTIQSMGKVLDSLYAKVKKLS